MPPTISCFDSSSASEEIAVVNIILANIGKAMSELDFQGLYVSNNNSLVVHIFIYVYVRTDEIIFSMSHTQAQDSIFIPQKFY